ncbi:hypothetical protein QTP88_024171 [Uroleucon formosanum]
MDDPMLTVSVQRLTSRRRRHRRCRCQIKKKKQKRNKKRASRSFARPGRNRERISRSFAPVAADRDCVRVCVCEGERETYRDIVRGRERVTVRQTDGQTERGKNGKRSIAIPDRGHRSLADKNAGRCYFLLLRVWFDCTTTTNTSTTTDRHHHHQYLTPSSRSSQSYSSPATRSQTRAEETRHINYYRQQ